VTVYYFDSSAIVKRYIIEVGTTWLMATTDMASGHDILMPWARTFVFAARATLSL
jgi:hypothetical protein